MVLENFNLGLTAIQANQLALNIVSHNIANVNTPGYTRQRAEFITSQPQNATPGQLGTGVLVEEIIRINDEFTQLQLNVENRSLGEYTVRREILQQLENIFNEPTDTGLQKSLNEFFSAWQSLADSPEDIASRVLVVEKGKTLARILNSMATQLNALKSQIDDSVEMKVDKVNEITSQIAELNDQIAKIEVGGIQNANDLRDKRDELLLELNQILEVSVHETQDNTLIVEARGGVLVAGVYNIEIDAAVDSDGYLVPVDKESGARIYPQSGELQGYLDVREDVIDDALDALNSIAETLVEYVNRVHTRGAPLEQFTEVTSETSLVSSGQALNTLDWDFEPQNGSFTISAYDSNGVFSEQHTISINPGSDTLEDIRDRINTAFSSGSVVASITSNKELVISSSSGYSFNFVNHSDASGDSSDFLLAMGINTFFTGTSALTIDVSETIESNPELIAAAKSNSPGDNRNALDIASLQNELLLDSGLSLIHI